MIHEAFKIGFSLGFGCFMGLALGAGVCLAVVKIFESIRWNLKYREQKKRFEANKPSSGFCPRKDRFGFRKGRTGNIRRAYKGAEE